MTRQPFVAAVVVTYHRTDLLRRCVDALLTQSRAPDLLLVVDNGGEARAALEDVEQAEIIKTGENIGPAGGYALGFHTAMSRQADKIWAVDDDSEPDTHCLEKLLSVSDGRHVMVPLQVKPTGARGYPPSWNGSLFDAACVKAVGVPREDFFFWTEDTEYYWRLRQAGFLQRRVSDALVVHHSPERRIRGQARNWRLYYEVRNTLYFRMKIQRQPKHFLRALRVVFGKLAVIMLFEPRKFRSARLWISGVADFLRGRLGKVVDPDTWPQEVAKPKSTTG